MISSVRQPFDRNRIHSRDLVEQRVGHGFGESRLDIVPILNAGAFSVSNLIQFITADIATMACVFSSPTTPAPNRNVSLIDRATGTRSSSVKEIVFHVFLLL